jgi:hypothetical protein
VATVWIQNGPLAGQSFEIGKELVIGREQAGVTIEDARVSRRHAIVREIPGGIEVEDLGSTNGTFIDGKRLEDARTVGEGAEIRVGSTVLEVRGVVRVEVTRARPGPDPGATQLEPRPQSPELTRARAAPHERVEEIGRGRPERRSAQPVPPAALVVPAPPVADFSPPAMPRRRGLASRSWVPVALSFGSVILTAIALIVYFAVR